MTQQREFGYDYRDYCFYKHIGTSLEEGVNNWLALVKEYGGVQTAMFAVRSFVNKMGAFDENQAEALNYVRELGFNIDKYLYPRKPANVLYAMLDRDLHHVLVDDFTNKVAEMREEIVNEQQSV